MIQISFLYGELFFAAVWILARAVSWVVRGRIDLRREALLLLMYVNLAVIVRFVFFPMHRIEGKIQPLVYDSSAVFPLNVNLTPFRSPLIYPNTRDRFLNLFGNVAMFIPTGIILPILFRKLDRFFKIVLTGALISLAIEILQLPFASRVTDVDDLILNTLGVAIGAAIMLAVRALLKKRRRAEAGQQSG